LSHRHHPANHRYIPAQPLLVPLNLDVVCNNTPNNQWMPATDTTLILEGGNSKNRKTEVHRCMIEKDKKHNGESN
jgi:hypothetical protein